MVSAGHGHSHSLGCADDACSENQNLKAVNVSMCLSSWGFCPCLTLAWPGWLGLAWLTSLLDWSGLCSPSDGCPVSDGRCCSSALHAICSLLLAVRFCPTSKAAADIRSHLPPSLSHALSSSIRFIADPVAAIICCLLTLYFAFPLVIEAMPAFVCFFVALSMVCSNAVSVIINATW